MVIASCSSAVGRHYYCCCSPCCIHAGSRLVSTRLDYRSPCWIHAGWPNPKRVKPNQHPQRALQSNHGQSRHLELEWAWRTVRITQQQRDYLHDRPASREEKCIKDRRSQFCELPVRQILPRRQRNGETKGTQRLQTAKVDQRSGLPTTANRFDSS